MQCNQQTRKWRDPNNGGEGTKHRTKAEENARGPNTPHEGEKHYTWAEYAARRWKTLHVGRIHRTKAEGTARCHQTLHEGGKPLHEGRIHHKVIVCRVWRISFFPKWLWLASGAFLHFQSGCGSSLAHFCLFKKVVARAWCSSTFSRWLWL